MHLKKMEWFNKLEQGDKSHKAMMAKNKYKVIIVKYLRFHIKMSNTEVHKIYFWTHEGPVDEGSRGVPGNQVKY